MIKRRSSKDKNGASSSRIIVLIDGSLPSLASATLAVQLAQKNHSMGIHGLYVIDETLIFDTYTSYDGELTHPGTPSSRAELVSWFQDQGQLVLDWLEARCLEAGVPVTTDLLLGSLLDVINKQEGQAALLAFGRRGRNHAKDTDVLGHNFQNIAHQVKTPYLVGGKNQLPIKQILLVVEPNRNEKLIADWGRRLHHDLNAEINALIFGKNDSELARLRSNLTNYGLANKCLPSQTSRSVENIISAAFDRQVDLIVMGGYRHNKLITRFVGSVLEQVLKTVPLPVLVV